MTGASEAAGHGPPPDRGRAPPRPPAALTEASPAGSLASTSATGAAAGASTASGVGRPGFVLFERPQRARTAPRLTSTGALLGCVPSPRYASSSPAAIQPRTVEYPRPTRRPPGPIGRAGELAGRSHPVARRRPGAPHAGGKIRGGLERAGAQEDPGGGVSPCHIAPGVPQCAGAPGVTIRRCRYIPPPADRDKLAPAYPPRSATLPTLYALRGRCRRKRHRGPAMPR